MARRKKQNEWIAIIDLDQPSVRRPIVLLNSDLDETATFPSVQAIKEVQRTHLMRDFCWHAFNYATGESEEI